MYYVQLADDAFGDRQQPRRPTTGGDGDRGRGRSGRRRRDVRRRHRRRLGLHRRRGDGSVGFRRHVGDQPETRYVREHVAGSRTRRAVFPVINLFRGRVL